MGFNNLYTLCYFWFFFVIRISTNKPKQVQRTTANNKTFFFTLRGFIRLKLLVLSITIIYCRTNLNIRGVFCFIYYRWCLNVLHFVRHLYGWKKIYIGMQKKKKLLKWTWWYTFSIVAFDWKNNIGKVMA